MAINNSPFARVKKPLKSDMNVVPYIDVMLVLLIIFMVASPMLTTGVEVDLPTVKADAIDMVKILPVIVSLKENGDIYHTSSEGKDQKLSKDALIETLKKSQHEMASLTVLIRADKALPYGSVMSLMAILKESGIAKVGLLTEDPE